MKESGKIIAQIITVVVFSTTLALVANGVRKEGLSLVMPFPPEYRCASRMTEGRAMQVPEALGQCGREGVLFVDARSKEAYEKGKIEGALNLPYSFLEAVSQETVERVRQYRTIIVYCDSENAEISKLMAGELSESGLKEVWYLEGGFLRWIEAGGPYRGEKPEVYEQGT